MDRPTLFARRVFLGAAIYGIIALAPQFALEERLGRDFPPPITHPEYFYGFVGLALAWQFVFLLIARDVVRYRAFMPLAVVEKLSFAVAVGVLLAQDRVAPATVLFAGIDFVLALLFALAWLRTGRRAG